MERYVIWLINYTISVPFCKWIVNVLVENNSLECGAPKVLLNWLLCLFFRVVFNYYIFLGTVYLVL